MIIRPYLTFQGTCEQAIELYKKAFQTDIIELSRFSDIPSNQGYHVPDTYKDKILQATLKFGDDFIRLSDCPPDNELSDSESERISLAIEASTAEVQHAFSVLEEEGRVGMPLAETFYSSCAGVVYDKFGVMWNFVGHE